MKENPFHKAETLPVRWKLLFWGNVGVGKTPLALQFPKPVMIDLDGGSNHYRKGAEGGIEFDVIRANEVSSWTKILELTEWLEKNTGIYETLILDPITLIRDIHINHLDDIFLRKERAKPGKSFESYVQWQMYHWNIQKGEWQSWCMRLLSLDMNIISIAREKEETKSTKDKEDKVSFVHTGKMLFDSDKNDDYLFDTIIRIVKEKDGTSKCICSRDRSQRFLKIHEPAKEFKLDYKEFERLAVGGK